MIYIQRIIHFGCVFYNFFYISFDKGHRDAEISAILCRLLWFCFPFAVRNLPGLHHANVSVYYISDHQHLVEI